MPCVTGRRKGNATAMSARAALVLGFCLIVAAILHGGIWSAGHDFVMNRFTGTYEFVPSDDAGGDEDTRWPRHAALTAPEGDARVDPSLRRR